MSHVGVRWVMVGSCGSCKDDGMGHTGWGWLGHVGIGWGGS